MSHKNPSSSMLLCSQPQKCVHLSFLVYLTAGFDVCAETYYYFKLCTSNPKLTHLNNQKPNGGNLHEGHAFIP
jgi:hypothetical protein